MSEAVRPEDHIGLVKFVALRLHRTSGADLDDLIGAGKVGLMKGVALFDPNKGVIGSFLFTCIRQEMLATVVHKRDIIPRKRRQRTVGDPPIRTLSTNHELGEGFTVEDTLVAEAPAQEPGISVGLETLLSVLSDRERDVVESHAHGVTLSQIGRRMGVSRERVRQIHERALGKLRKKAAKSRYGTQGGK